MLGFLVRPVDGINYNFIMGMYLFFDALGAVFLALETKIESVRGVSLVFAPFVPATVWCFFVRRRWLNAKTKSE